MHHPRPRPRIFWAWTLTITSALLAVVWVGSMKVIVSQRIGLLTWMELWGGRLSVCTYQSKDDALGQHPYGDHRSTSWNPAADWTFSRHVRMYWGLHFENLAPGTGRGPRQAWRIPLWPFVLLTGVPGVWMLVKTRKHTNPHACPACGYDRTGLPQAAPCPECGKGKGENR